MKKKLIVGTNKENKIQNKKRNEEKRNGKE